MFDYAGMMADANKLCAALKGREYGIVAFISEMVELLDQCSKETGQPNASKMIQVSAEELIMLRDFRQNKVERAYKELTEIRELREALTESIKKDNQMRSNHE